MDARAIYYWAIGIFGRRKYAIHPGALRAIWQQSIDRTRTRYSKRLFGNFVCLLIFNTVSYESNPVRLPIKRVLLRVQYRPYVRGTANAFSTISGDSIGDQSTDYSAHNYMDLPQHNSST